MKTRFLALLVAVFVMIGLASAQSYSIRITYNTNLRVAGSLQSNIVETAPAGTILNVIGSANRWLQISRNGHVWMADWVGYTVSSRPLRPRRKRRPSAISTIAALSTGNAIPTSNGSAATLSFRLDIALSLRNRRQ